MFQEIFSVPTVVRMYFAVNVRPAAPQTIDREYHIAFQVPTIGKRNLPSRFARHKSWRSHRHTIVANRLFGLLLLDINVIMNGNVVQDDIQNDIDV